MSQFSSRPVRSRLLTAAGTSAGWLLLLGLLAPAASQAETVMERMTRLARAGEQGCADPWTHSRGLDKCVCIKAGYSKQWGQCLPMAPDLASGKTKAGSAAVTSALPPPAATGALPKAEADEKIEAGARKTQDLNTLKPNTLDPKPEAAGAETPGSEPPETERAEIEPGNVRPDEPNAAPNAGPAVDDDAASRMEQVARAQDCLASLDLYHGAVDGERNAATVDAYRDFATRRGLPPSEGLLSFRAQAALLGACGERWVSANAD